MKHPIWILNSALALLFIIVLLFSAFSRQPKPHRQSIKPSAVSSEFVSIPTVNSSKIYERDIFDTYEKEKKKTQEPVNLPVPQPPVVTQTKAPAIPEPEFLEPLNIALKGIIFIAGQEDKNRAVIQDKQTTREMNYRVGNTVQDAQLIRIFNNKIVLLRTNGQQEVIYLREADAQHDPAFNMLGKWDDVIQKSADDAYTINKHAFTKRIENLSQFIDVLDLTTAYQKGKNIGCRIGDLAKDSLGVALGLESGDIILRVDNIPAAATSDRFAIYKNVTQKRDGQEIVVELQRKGRPLTLHYHLEQFKLADKYPLRNPSQELEAQRTMQEKQLKAIDSKRQLTPLGNEIQRRERSAMRNHAERNTKQERTQ